MTIYITCPKCKDGELEFEEEETDDGHPINSLSSIVCFLNPEARCCGCAFSETEVEALEREATERANEPGRWEP
jgi:hypothetical protein